MKTRFPFSVIFILGLGILIGILILQMNPQTSHESGRHESRNDSIARGSHGGWLFSGNDLQVEVKIFETGIPPEFRVYVTDAAGKNVALNEVDLTIHLNRLDRVDEIHFKPVGEYLLGDMTVVEPHSFDVKIHARWKDQIYEWEFSQIEARAELPDEAIKNAGITIKTAGPAQLKSLLKLSGEIGLNEEKVVHIVPRLDGVVKKVFKDLGDRVVPGDVLAIIESRELADAKINYLVATKQITLAKVDMERETLLFKNTTRMLDLLQQKLDLEEVYRELKDLQIGKSRELLIPAYAKLSLAKSVYLREKKLFNKGISAESEYLLAVENYKSGEAKYIALREKIAYDGQWAVRQKTRTYEMEELKLQTARQKLFALGLTKKEVSTLSDQKEHAFTRYELRSPLGGVIIQKHLSTGEAVKSDDGVFLLADLSDVWANIAIPAKDLKYVKLGQTVTVKSENLGLEAKGKLTYLDSIIDEKNRTVTGRVVIPNPGEHWRPGTFITLELVLEERTVPIAV
ncbi:MAG: efflux RND transporter periplasmic adaptor subunit, partial [Nitrospinae bacterium]|nr:efflux RND transporter periplasmic adaptor subunit [Nitrospinota bacterium]